MGPELPLELQAARRASQAARMRGSLADSERDPGSALDLDALLQDDEVDEVDVGQHREGVLRAGALDVEIAGPERAAARVEVAALEDEHLLLAQVAVGREGRAGGHADEAAVAVRDARPGRQVDEVD